MSDTLRINNLFTTAIAYSTLTGSTMTSNSLALSTLTVSSINNGAPGVAAYSTFNASSINATSTITGSTINVLTGRMGIGTSSPAELLDIVNSGSTIMGVRLQNQFSAGYLSMGAVVGVNSYIGLQAGATTTSALTTPTLCVTNANNVGIGTANPGHPLDVSGNTTVLARFQQSVDFARISLDAPSGGDIIYKAGGVSKWGIACISNKLQFLLNDVTSTVPMTLDTSGFVGIGSTTPGYLLTVGTNANPSANSAGTTVLQCNGNLNIFRNRLIFSSAPTDWNHCIYNNSFNLDNEGAWDGMKFNVYNGAWFRVGNAAGLVPGTAMFITSGGQIGIGTTVPFANTTVDIRGAVSINNGTNAANVLNRMAAGSLTIGSTSTNYGGEFSGSWAMTSTAGLMMECADNTEIAVHDSGTRLASFMYYTGSANNFTLGRNMGYGVASVYIAGALSKSSGAFDIEHPLYPDTNKRLVHSFVEGPRCDLIYRGKTTLVNGTASVDINKECTHSPECAMDDGTFEALCANPQIFLQNNQSFDRVRGTIAGCILTITCENPVSNMVIEWMVVAERADSFIKQWDRTNPDGYLITQYTK
jgi:hypothetical protein